MRARALPSFARSTNFIIRVHQFTARIAIEISITPVLNCIYASVVHALNTLSIYEHEHKMHWLCQHEPI